MILPVISFSNNYQPSPPYQPSTPYLLYQQPAPLYPAIHLQIGNNYNNGNNLFIYYCQILKVLSAEALISNTLFGSYIKSKTASS